MGGAGVRFGLLAAVDERDDVVERVRAGSAADAADVAVAGEDALSELAVRRGAVRDPLRLAVAFAFAVGAAGLPWRRLRHPREETLARVRQLRAQGRMVEAIADELHKSENYVRRLIRQIETEGSPE